MPKGYKKDGSYAGKIFKKGIYQGFGFKKGNKNWLGKKHTEETKEKQIVLI